MLPQNPNIIPIPFAQNGQKNTIATNPAGPADPAASWNEGFPPVTRIIRPAGGKPPYGLDFNGLFFALSQHTFFQQSGGVYPWSNALDYPAGAHVLGSDGKEYVALQASGPAVSGAGARNPVNSTSSGYWQQTQAAMTKASLPKLPGVVLTLPTSGTRVTAPADGWYLLRGRPGPGDQPGTYYVALSTGEEDTGLAVNGLTDGTISATALLPVNAGASVLVRYTVTTNLALIFFYANGAA